jgi:hypothetical protein
VALTADAVVSLIVLSASLHGVVTPTGPQRRWLSVSGLLQREDSWKEESMFKVALSVMTVLLLIGFTSSVLSAGQTPTDTRAAQASLVKEVKAHIDTAKAAAGKEWPWFQQMLCSNAQLGGDVIGMFFAASRLLAPDADFEPVRAFDNL